jgi:hypothetical protein
VCGNELYGQVPETYSPTVKKETQRLLIYLMTQGWTTCLLDVDTAFLYGDIDTELWVVYPEGFPGFLDTLRQYARVLKGQYGTKQAQRMWDRFRNKVLGDLGYKPTESDPALFYKITWENGVQLLTLIGAYVDDFHFVSQDPNELERVLSTNNKQWNLKIKKEFNKLLGVKLHRTSTSTLLYDDTYFSEVALELGLLDKFRYKPTLPSHNTKYLPNTQYKSSRELLELYQQLVGSLMWGVNTWRIDGTYIVNHLARFLANPSFEHLDAAIDVLYYFISTKQLGLPYTRCDTVATSPMRIECITYSDADWDKEFDHVSVSGHVMQICAPSERDAVQNSPSGVEPTLPKYNVISWFSRKQRDHVAMSSEDAETTAAVPSGHLIQWARGLFDELHLISKTSPERP